MGMQPWDYHSELTSSRLNVIAEALLKVFHDTHDDLNTSLDNSYTRGTATFGRQRERIIQLCQSQNHHDWLDLRNTSNDLTFSIGGIPCRFFTDDHQNPKKKSFWRRNEQDNLFPLDEGSPVLWRFIVEKPLTEDSDASVYFVGANQAQDVVCEWKYQEAVRVLKVTDETRYEEVQIKEPEVSIPKANVELPPKEQDDVEKGTGTNS